ncbi:MAG: hypothetical protein MAG453_01470 [Calditrichaeota bacterium]|nr:hypothetical protein [Calditrichota bacterium]
MENRALIDEENLSAIMDGELRGEPLLESIDALVEDASLREFWRNARSLQKALNRRAEAGADTPPEALWERVERRTGTRRAKVISLKRWSPQVWAAAASIVLVFSLALAGLLRGTLPPEAAARTVELGSREGRMSEQRFVQITSELLMADSRYHRKMLEVMETVNREVYGAGGETRAEETRAASELASSESGALERRSGSGSGEPAAEPRRGQSGGARESDVRFNLR